MLDLNESREINIFFVKNSKLFFNRKNKKKRNDYVLNVDRIIKEKFECECFVLNYTQSFLLNFEIKKLLDKAISIANKKYDRIIYVNSNMSTSGIINTIEFLDANYRKHKVIFKYLIIDEKEELKHLPFKYSNENMVIINSLEQFEYIRDHLPDSSQN